MMNSNLQLLVLIPAPVQLLLDVQRICQCNTCLVVIWVFGIGTMFCLFSCLVGFDSLGLLLLPMGFVLSDAHMALYCLASFCPIGFYTAAFGGLTSNFLPQMHV